MTNQCGSDSICYNITALDDHFGVCCPDTLQINDLQILPGNYSASSTIIAQGTVVDSTTFKAFDRIVLDKDFEILLGSVFEILLEQCEIRN